MSINKNMQCFFVSDLHGSIDRYGKLFQAMVDNPPAALFMGGDLLPHSLISVEIDGVLCRDFTRDYLIPEFTRLRNKLGNRYPKVFLILGNDDNRSDEDLFIKASDSGIWEYIHNRKIGLDVFRVYGYSFVPPTPFMLKDWDRYDVSRFVDIGCVSPEEGTRTVPVSNREIRFSTIKDDLEQLTGDDKLEKSIFLFHTPPYDTLLDRTQDDNKMVDYAPVDVHVGSIAVRRFIESRQPYITLHGHVHESSDITGSWKDMIGGTHLFSAAYQGAELALVTFNLDEPDKAKRLLI